MNILETLAHVIDNSPWSKARLARHIGLTPQGLENRLASNKKRSIGVDNAIQILDPLGYDLVVVPKGAERLPKGSMRVSMPEVADDEQV